MLKDSIESLREDYKKNKLDKKDLQADPFVQFEQWFEEARQAGLYEPNAMNLATADKRGKPSARIVLLKGFDKDGFRFFTNYESKKGQQLLENPFAALTFFWPELERQVRIEGEISKISDADSRDYFNKRPKGSQIGAIISPQSKIIPSREYLEERQRKFELDPADTIYTKPEHWGGFELKPVLVEFWQGRSSRLHDRLEFKLTAQNSWEISRLAP
jgi:pyridoxamine-phosphate oxidase